jgi:hypothetical protein
VSLLIRRPREFFLAIGVRVAGQTTPANADGATLAKSRAKAKRVATQYRT